MAQISIDQAMQFALGRHQAGQLAEAEAIYRQILAQAPDTAEAWHLMGLIACQLSHFEKAQVLISRAAELKPNSADAFGNLGVVLEKLGKRDEAIAAYKRAAEINPSQAGALGNLGGALRDAGRWEEAAATYKQAAEINPNDAEMYRNLSVASYRQGKLDDADAACRQEIRLRPQSAEAYGNLGIILRDRELLADAEGAFRKAIELKGDFSQAHIDLGSVLRQTGRLDEALAAFRRVAEINPLDPQAHNNIGIVLQDQRKLEEAAGEFQKAIDLDPNRGEFHGNLGSGLTELGRLQEAITACNQAIQLKPADPDLHCHLGVALHRQREMPKALASYEEAIRLQPDHTGAHWNRALALLLMGDFQRGWIDYQARLQIPDLAKSLAEFTQPVWTGQNIAGKTILLFAEQGLGDAIQFSRYAAMVADRGAKVVIECPEPLCRLMSGVAGVTRAIVQGSARPRFDYYCPLLNLPGIFGTRVDTIPADVPYLLPDAAHIDAWAKKIQLQPDRLNVGLVWAGRPTHVNDRNRSIPLPQLAPLAAVKGVRFFNLRKDETSAKPTIAPAGMDLIDFGPSLRHFGDTAALVANLDLVISVDTAAAHLAGAMGRPTWVLLPYSPDWRWMLDRADSPWYPTMRLFRQPSIGQWEPVIQRVANELARFRKETLEARASQKT